MRPIFLLLLFGFCTMPTFGQEQKPTFDLFGDSKPEPAEKAYKQVTEGTLLTIDLEELKALREAAPNYFNIDIPLTNGNSLELHLGKINIFAEGFKLETSSGSRTSDIDLGVHYKGVVAGHSGSLVTVSVYEQELVAVFSDGRHSYELAKLNDKADRYILYRTVDLAERLKKQLLQFECHTETEGRDLPDYTDDQLFGVSDNRNGCKVIQVYLVADFSYYTVCGSDVTETSNRLTAVFAQTMTIYTAESINMVTSGIFIWDTNDNAFDEGADSETQRNQFRDYYNSTGAGWPGDLAQLISGTTVSATGGGGIAFFDGLCTSDSYALTRAGGSSPILDWTMYSRFVKVLTHEIGHNLNSRHTHACVWNGDGTTIDDYGNVSPGGNPYEDAEGGACLEEPYKLNVFPTIMSYFDSRNHGTFNMTNGMGTQPGNVMRNYVMNAGCLDDGSNVPPVARCQDVTVQLDVNGNGSTTAAAVDDGSYDACGGLQPLVLSQTSFTCAEVGENTEFLTITDLDGNISYCFLTVTVEDNIPPSAQCQNVTVQLNANGNGSITAAAVNNGSSDACGIQSVSLSQTSFGCAEVGSNLETLTVVDVNGNLSTCNTTVTVEDNIKPVPVCFDPTVELQPNGLYTLLQSDIYDAINSSDNCSIASVDFPGVTYTCDDAYQTFPVVVTIEDPSGNTGQCTAMVTVEIGTALPPEWTANDIGDQGDGSFYEYDPCINDNPDLGDFTIGTGGYNLIPQDSDNLAFASVPLCGDGGIQARIRDVVGGYAGLMIRESSDPGSKMYAVYSNLTNLLRREIRYTQNGPRSSNTSYASFPEWLRLTRQGDLLRAFYRNSSGGSWVLFHQAYLPMSNCVEMGLAVFSTDPFGNATAVIGEVRYLSQGGSLAMPNTMEWTAESAPVIKAGILPNPVRDAFTLQFSRPLVAEGQATLLNEFGQLIARQPIMEGETELDWNAASLPAGLYFLEVFTEDGYREVLKVVRQ
ncbi:M12 family metallo-peptidase [Phaeodactylibacter xiamenensis]|uniref:M12 family metallo-peptidase n=1 Tax=Phaeodactylibacter xiamenensis TaxID=1524460 RepID=UPI003BA9FC4D